MVFFKKVEIRSQKTKYDDETQQGIFAMEPIKKGERIWYCECGAKDALFRRDQLLDIIDSHPKLDYFVRSYSYMVGDDVYALPVTFMQEENNDECYLFNHSCEPNSGFSDQVFDDVVRPNADPEDAFGIVACRDIQPGDEITYHYGFLETEASLIYNMECKCGSPSCAKNLTFDYYRDPAFVAKYFDYMTPYLKRKTLDIAVRWHSSETWLKRVKSEHDAMTTTTTTTTATPEDPNEFIYSLFSLKAIEKGQLVASFANGLVAESAHFIRNSPTPNCTIVGCNVFANADIPPQTELTIYYHGILL